MFFYALGDASIRGQLSSICPGSRVTEQLPLCKPITEDLQIQGTSRNLKPSFEYGFYPLFSEKGDRLQVLFLTAKTSHSIPVLNCALIQLQWKVFDKPFCLLFPLAVRVVSSCTSSRVGFNKTLYQRSV